MKKQFLLGIGFTIITVFLLSLLWEFVLEDLVQSGIPESNFERWEFVVTSVAFALLALIYPTIMGLRSIRKYHQAGIKQRESEENLKPSLILLNAIREAQSKYIIASDSKKLFDDLLAKTLDLTKSEFGFIAEVLINNEGKKYLKNHTLTNIAWNKETQELYEKYVDTGLEFYNLDSLFGAVISTGEPVISNDPATDPRRCGVPQGRPPLKAFLGLPFYYGEKLIGMVGMANRAGGYDEDLIQYLQPFLVTCSQLMQAWNKERQQKRLEKALGESETRLQAIVNNTTSYIYIKDLRGRYTLANSSFQSLFHLPNDQIIGKTDHELFSKEAADTIVTNDRKVLETGSSIELEETGIINDEVRIYISNKFPLIDSHGKPCGICGISTDITDRKRMEQKIKEAKEQAEKTNKSKSEFLSRMSHEFRTPLNAILGFTQLLDLNGDKNLSESQQKDIKIILQSSEHLLALINEVLDIARIDQGQLDISLEEVQLNQVITDLITMFQPMAKQRGIRIRDQISNKHLVVLADPRYLKQVLVNLVSNAIKYNKDQGSVTLDYETADAGKLRIRIIDTGRGIPKECQDELFEPFTRFEINHHPEIEGTGLGLTISKMLMEKMQGSIFVDSAPGEGSCFTIEIPTVKGEK